LCSYSVKFLIVEHLVSVCYNMLSLESVPDVEYSSRAFGRTTVQLCILIFLGTPCILSWKVASKNFTCHPIPVWNL
jgi:hypothetical protein